MRTELIINTKQNAKSCHYSGNELQFVGSIGFMKAWTFQKLSLKASVARSQIFIEAGSLGLQTWWPDMGWPQVEIFAKCVETTSSYAKEKRWSDAVVATSTKKLRWHPNAPPPGTADKSILCSRSALEFCFEPWLEKPGAGGGGPGGTFPSGPHQFHFLGGTWGDQYITKMGPFCFSWTVFHHLQ